MKRYILVYEVGCYPELGGGTYFESFETEQEVDKRVPEIFKQYEDVVEILAAGELRPFEYKAIEVVTKIMRV